MRETLQVVSSMEKLIYQGSTDEENRVRAALKEATNSIVSTVGSRGLDAVVLAGGFGRGEGALLREDGSEGLPFNDFDFLLVGTRSSVPVRVLSKLKRMLPRVLNVDFVDINYMRASDFKRVSPTVFFYELRNANRVLWGSPDALGTLPFFDPSELPLTEATRLFLNRGLGLLSVLLQLDDAQSGELVGRRAAVAWSKVVLTAGDSFLLERKLYHWSYVERMKRLAEIAQFSALEAEFAETYLRAAMFKLTADFSLLPTQDPSKLCYEARQIHERYFRTLERKRTFADLTDWKAYPTVVLRAGLQPLRRRLKEYLTERGDMVARFRSLWRFARLPLWNEERRLAILPLLLYAVLEPGSQAREGSYVAEACEIEYGRRDVRADDWKRLALELVGEFHP